VDAAVGEAADLGVEDDIAEERSGERSEPRPASARRLMAAVLVAVNLPILVATARALARGWQPLGDNGLLLVRARDVGTSHHPFLGTWTSASLVLHEHVNNPGPLYFDAIAPAIKLLGPWVGVAVGVMLVNMAASSLAVVMARRISGAESMVAVAIVTVGLQFAMGSELLFDVWQPNALVLPFFAFLVVVTALAGGDLAMVPWVVGVGSFVVQTHMSHAPLVAILSLAATGAAVWSLRRRGATPSWRRPLVWTCVVAVVAWSQPLIEEFTGRGRGNLSRIVTSGGGGDAPTIGASRAVRLVSETTVMGPWFTRGTFENAVSSIGTSADPLQGLLAPGPAAVVVGLAVAVLAAVGVWAHRTGRRGLAAMGAVASVTVVAATVALAMSPVNMVGLAAHQMRWLWPVGALATAVVLTALMSAVPSSADARRRGLIVSAGAALVVAVASLPTYRSRSFGPVDSAANLPVAQELVEGLEALEGRGTVLFDYTGIRYGEPYSGLVFAELQDRDIPFVLDDEGLIRQFGEGRRDDGTAVLRMWQVEGAAAMEVPEGAERVAYADGLTPAERAEIAELDDQVRSGAIDGDDLQRWTALDERRRLHAVALLVEPV
jgi:hypothetical protein